MKKDLTKLCSLVIEENKANARKRSAWRKFKKAKVASKEANDKLQVAWDNLASKKEWLDDELDKMKIDPNHTNVWESFKEFREVKSKEIADLISKANKEHGLMLEEFALAGDETPRSSVSFAHRRKGYHHQRQRDRYNAQVKELINELNKARDDANKKAAFSYEYIVAKREHDEARKNHEILLNEYNLIKADREKKHQSFLEAQKRHEQIRNQLQEAAEKCRLCTKFNF